ncbi:MAG TPA: type II toxin-antitoxin system HicA family toxin [Candidatus Paceibacterota bacterium]
MSKRPSTKASKVFRALISLGWEIKRHGGGSHLVLDKKGYPNFVWAFRNEDEIGPRMLARIAKHTGLKSEDL